jgi:DNA-binding GntR family transcriptional regulator
MMNDLISLSSQAYTAIKKDILTCVLSPGSTIAQSQLVKGYDFGLTPVREALKRLEQEGFVRSIPRFGYLITAITLKDVEDLYDLRLILEQSAVRMAIERASDEQLYQIQQEAAFTYTFRDPESYLSFLDHNTSFHVAIALASRNRKLAEMLAKILNEMTRIFNLGLDLRDSAQEMRDEHIALASALADRDALRAEQVVSDQICRSRQRVTEMLIEHMHQQDVAELSG